MFSDILPPEKPISWTSRYNIFVDGIADRTLGSFRHLQLNEKDSTTLKTIKIAGVALAGIAVVALLCWAIVKGARMFRSPERIYPVESPARSVPEELRTAVGSVIGETTESLYTAAETVIEKATESLHSAAEMVIEKAAESLQSARETVVDTVAAVADTIRASPGGSRRAGRY